MKHKIFVVGALVGVAAFAGAQAPTAKEVELMSYTTRAKSLKKVLAELSAKTGQHLEPSPVLANYTIVANFNGVPTSAMYAKLADLVSGVWLQSGPIYYLSPSGSVRASDERRVAQLKLAQIAAELEKKRKAVYTPLTNEEAIKYVAASNQENRSGLEDSKFISPEMRAVYQALETVDLSKVAAMKPGDRIVFSSTPNPMQFPASSKLLKIANDYLTERNMVMEAWQAATPNSDYSENMAVGPVVGASFSVALQPSSGSGLALNLDIFNQKRAVIASASYSFGEFYQSFLATTAAQPKATPIKQSPLTQKIKTFLKQSFGMQGEGGPNTEGVDWTKVDPAVYDFITKPEEVEMLDTMPTDAVMQAAETSHKNVLACLPDSMGLLLYFGEMMGGGEQDLTLEVFASYLKESQMDTRDEGDWKLIRPQSYAPERANFMPRDILGNGIRAIFKNPAAAQNAMGSIFASMEFPEAAYEILPLILSMYSGGASIGANFADPQSMKAFAILSTGQLFELSRGGKVGWNTLNESQRRFYFRQIFGANGYLSETEPAMEAMDASVSANTPDEAPSAGVQRIAQMNPSRDATELLPTGIPLNSYLELTTNETPQYYIYTKDGGTKPYQNRPMQLEEIGYYLMLAKHPERGSPDQSIPTAFTGFSRVSFITKTLTHHLTAKHTRTFATTQSVRAPGSKITPFSEMNPEEKTTIERIQKETTENPPSEAVPPPPDVQTVPPVTSGQK